jgi:hypothetical protein
MKLSQVNGVRTHIVRRGKRKHNELAPASGALLVSPSRDLDDGRAGGADTALRGRGTVVVSGAGHPNGLKKSVLKSGGGVPDFGCRLWNPPIAPWKDVVGAFQPGLGLGYSHGPLLEAPLGPKSKPLPV